MSVITLTAKATEFDVFETSVFDATSLLVESDVNESEWKNNIKFHSGINDQKDTIINRLSWRVQWQGSQDEESYWNVDAKLRVYDKQDMQFDSNESLDYDLNFVSFYLQKTYKDSSLKAGYQTVVLGYMDLLSVSNVFTPQDYSEPLFVSPEDSRIGQAILNWSWYQGDRQTDLYVNLYPVESRYPVSNIDEILTGIFGANSYTLTDTLPDALSEPEVLIKTQVQNDKHEYQWIIASLIQNDPSLKQNTFAPTYLIDAEYPRYQMLAGAYSFTEGNHQYKTEIIFKDDIKPLDAGGLTLDETTMAIGWEYSANGDYILTVESSKTQRTIPQQVAGIIGIGSVEKGLDQTVASFRKSIFNDTISIVLFTGKLNPGDVRISSASISYTPLDDFIIELAHTDVKAANNQNNLFTSSTLLSLSYFW